MNLINKKLLQQKVLTFEYPNAERQANAKKLLEGWQKALKDSDLEKTKEKSVQGKFLNTFFEAILGYSDVTTGQDEWTLTQHPRIENDSKEPDGSLGWFTKDKKITRAVIELKDAKNQLDKKQNRGTEKLTPIEQAYLYATKYEGCNWIIVSNFKEIRLYNKHRTQEFYEKFDVVNLTQESEFRRFYLLLSKETLISREEESLVDALAKVTTEAEQDITKKFYAEYRQARINLLNHLSEHNPEIQKNKLLEKTQKILDRFIFTLFCEDTSTLLPLNLVKNTYERAISSLTPNDERVWAEFKGLFLAIDKGNNRVKPPINKYNGGLFAADTVLDNLVIKDVAWQELIELAKYDFETDLNVNILGHIFEQSISDLEALKSSIYLATESGDHITTENGDRIILSREKTEFVEKKGRRKKEGIFYTPEYITRYIVENTVGKYLEEHPEKLETITILDPACGSGAFPNQAHSFLFKEYKIRHEQKLAEMESKGQRPDLFTYNPAENDKSILLNNIYGVDLNEESVEITRLALWLKTAKKDQALENLDKNIKCGNSLIDDPSVAGERAFNWSKQYEEVMKGGGFDVVVGNPPYGADIDTLYSWFELNYPNTSKGHKDTYKFFIDKGLSLVKENGYLGFIVPNTFLSQPKYSDLKDLVSQYEHYIVNLGDRIFEEAEVPVCILIIKKKKATNKPLIVDLSHLKTAEDFSTHLMSLSLGSERNKQRDVASIFGKIKLTLNDVFELKDAGIQYHRSNIGLRNKGGNDLYERIFQKTTEKKFPNSIRTFYGSLIDRYFISSETDEEFNLDYKSVLNENEHVSFSKESFMKKKIIWRQTASEIRATLSSGELWFRNTIQCAYLKDKYQDISLSYSLGVFNSRLYKFFYEYKVKEQGRVFPQVKLTYLRSIPFMIPSIEEQLNVGGKVEELIQLTKRFESEHSAVMQFLFDEYGFKTSRGQKVIVALGWNEFTEILEKKSKLDVSKKEELFTWFKSKQAGLQLLWNKIRDIDSQIDKEIYTLYGLTPEEIKIVEDSTEK